MDIRCRKTECAYNDKFTCRAKNIQIDKDCLCNKYLATEKNEPDTTKHILETPPDYSTNRECISMDISCKAKCLFNNSSKCESNGITVNAIKEKPFCVTFLKK